MCNAGHCQTSSQYSEVIMASDIRRTGQKTMVGEHSRGHTSLSSSLDGTHCDCELMAEDSVGANYRGYRMV
jgi:hypothetical protein